MTPKPRKMVCIGQSDRFGSGAMASQEWLQQVRDEPTRTQTHSVVDPQPSVTVFRVPDFVRARSPAYHHRENLQLGLHNRSLQTSGSQLVKLDIARCLHARLLTASSSWEAFATTVVGDVHTARGHYQHSGAQDHLSDEVVPFLLALDALFLVVFFQFRNFKRCFLEEDLAYLGARLLDNNRLLKNLLLLENQLPMYLLKNVVAQLVAMCAVPTDTAVKIQIQVANDLDIILKVAVSLLHPLEHPDESESMLCFLRRHKGNEYNNRSERFSNYLDEKYPLGHPNQSLHNCKHVLDCVYVVLCGHSLPYSHPQLASSPATRLDSIPSVSELQAIGITITDTAPTLNKIELSGWGYVRSAKLSLPKMCVHSETERVFHNLALHEWLNEGGERGDLRCFLQCMASLSNNPADFALLIDHGVMDNKVGDLVLGMWDRIESGLAIPRPPNSWLKCYQDIHNHRRNRLKQWRREVFVLFFSKPWTFVSLLGAIAILFFTAVQTWFTVVNSSNRSWRWPSAG